MTEKRQSAHLAREKGPNKRNARPGNKNGAKGAPVWAVRGAS